MDLSLKNSRLFKKKKVDKRAISSQRGIYVYISNVKETLIGYYVGIKNKTYLIY